MRIVAGRFRGRVLSTPAGTRTRPTLSRIREAIGNILAPRLPGSRFLDLYAGAGTVGLEALSRGSARVVFAEHDTHALGSLRANCRLLDPEGTQTEILATDAAQAAAVLAARGEGFDIVFLDPPYAGGAAQLAPLLPHLRAMLSEDGVVVYQHARRQSSGEPMEGWRLERRRTYGETAVSVYAADPGRIISKKEDSNHA